MRQLLALVVCDGSQFGEWVSCACAFQHVAVMGMLVAKDPEASMAVDSRDLLQKALLVFDWVGSFGPCLTRT